MDLLIRSVLNNDNINNKMVLNAHKKVEDPQKLINIKKEKTVNKSKVNTVLPIYFKVQENSSVKGIDQSRGLTRAITNSKNLIYFTLECGPGFVLGTGFLRGKLFLSKDYLLEIREKKQQRSNGSWKIRKRIRNESL